MRWVILQNHLPDDLTELFLNPPEGACEGEAWTLLRRGRARRIYHYRPDRAGAGWVVKWGRYAGLRRWLRAMREGSEAEREAAAAAAGAEAGLPVIALELAARTARWRWPLETVHVTRYLEGSRTLEAVYRGALDDPGALEGWLAKHAAMIGEMHEAGFVHGDLSVTNVLVSAQGDLRPIDLNNFRRTGGEERTERERDVARAAEAMAIAGLNPVELEGFLRRYAERGGACEAGGVDAWVEGLLKRNRKRVRQVCERAHRNATRRSRMMERFRCGGWTVFADRGADREGIAGAIERDSNGREGGKEFAIQAEGDPALLEAGLTPQDAWRMRFALRRCGIDLLGEMALARRRGASILIRRWPEGGEPAVASLKEPGRRRAALDAIGRSIGRLDRLGYRLRRIALEAWSMGPAREGGGCAELFTSDVAAIEKIEPGQEGRARFRALIEFAGRDPDGGWSRADLRRVAAAAGGRRPRVS